MSAMNISTKFLTDNRKAKFNRSKTYVGILQSGQAQDLSTYGENVMN